MTAYDLDAYSTKDLVDALQGRVGVPDFIVLGPEDAVEVLEHRGKPKHIYRPNPKRHGWEGPCIIIRVVD